MFSQNQKTINDTIKLYGVGLHNGINVNLIVKPASENFGIQFSKMLWEMWSRLDKKNNF